MCPSAPPGMVKVDQIKEDKINWHCMKRQESMIRCVLVCVCLCVFLCVASIRTANEIEE